MMPVNARSPRMLCGTYYPCSAPRYRTFSSTKRQGTTIALATRPPGVRGLRSAKILRVSCQGRPVFLGGDGGERTQRQKDRVCTAPANDDVEDRKRSHDDEGSSDAARAALAKMSRYMTVRPMARDTHASLRLLNWMAPTKNSIKTED